MTGKELREARRRLGLTQARLAALLGLGGGSKTVGRWERGERAISAPVATVMTLMVDQGPPDRLVSALRALAEQLRTAPGPEEIRAVATALDCLATRAALREENI